MNKTYALQNSITAVLVFVVFQKLNQLLCASWGFFHIQNEISNRICTFFGYGLAWLIAFCSLVSLYSICIEKNSGKNWPLYLLPFGILIAIAANACINWCMVSCLDVNANENWSLMFDSHLSYSRTQSWIVEIAAGVIFIVMLIKKKSN